MREYSPLSHQPFAPGARLAQPTAPGHVLLDDPAFSVMTDLRQVSAATTTPEESIDAAQAVMVRRSVRLLFVLDREGTIAGVITATDLLGEKPLRHIQAHGGSHADIRVADVMTPAERLEAVPLQEVAQMRVGHVVASLKAARRQHLLVSEAEGRRVRGIFSASQVARQLGMEVQTFEVAQTFAEVERALAH